MSTASIPSASRRRKASQDGSTEQLQRKRARHQLEDLFRTANGLELCLQALQEVDANFDGDGLEIIVKRIRDRQPYSEAELDILGMPIKEPSESPSEGILSIIAITNELRSNLAKLYCSALEASTVQSDHEESDGLIKARQKAIQDGIEALDPSDAAKPSNLLIEQADHPMQIGRPFETTGPPVSIYHPIFSRFQTLIQDQGFEPLPEDVVAAFDLIQIAAKVPRAGEGRMTQVKHPIGMLLRPPIVGLLWARNFRPDGVLHHVKNFGVVPLLVMKVEDEIGGTGGCDPDTEGSFSFRKLWTDKSLTRIQNVCCCPSFILSVAGPNITIHGGVLGTEFIVQPLTEMLKLANFPDPYGRAEYIAKIMAALRTCLDGLGGFYNGLTPADEEKPARFSPFFQEYDGFTLRYTSPNLLSDRVGRAMFNATVKRSADEEDSEGKPVKVKFTPRYCREAHTLLAEKNLAPQIRHFKELENATIPPRALKDVKEAVSMLHKDDWVFGDLRRPNMLCERDAPGGGTEQGAMLVDFD
ncbi:hypothetical protein FRC04_010261 [Tulasnella sp. 424]|nr:hypothetical protein FRC04_010261 [Tulasnella sp. 424]KAG8972649.1 hypothetical protein FRC05_009660 [Tulasnella sp. 425]